MKKLLCMLLCMLMLCSGAQAEAFQGHIKWDADAQGALDYLTAISEEDVKQLKKLAEAMAELAAGLDISFGWQDDGIYGALSLMDTLLLDMSVWVQAEQGVIMSNLLPDHYLSVSSSPEETAASQAAYEQLENMEWTALAADMLDQLYNWQTGLSITEEHGGFMGDAYEGGVFRKSRTFDDKAVAELVAAMVDVLDKYGINDALLDDYLGESGLISSFVRWNRQIAEENRYSYVLHEVYGLNEEPVGYSLIVHEAGEQVMTFSLAMAENGWRAIWGYGLNGQNYYIRVECIDGDQTESTVFTLFAYRDPLREGYLAVEPYVENILLMIEAQLTTRENGWRAEAEVIDPAAAIVDTYYVLDSESRADGGSKVEVAWYPSGEDGRAETPMQKVTVTISPCEPKVWSTASMTEISMDNGGDTELIDSLVEEAMQDLLVKLFKLVPTQMLTMLLTI